MQISEILPLVAMQAPSADPLLVEEATRLAVAEFMADTQIFTNYVSIAAQPCLKEYLVIVEPGEVLVGIIDVKINGESTDNWLRDDHEDVIIFTHSLNPCDSVELKYSWKIPYDACTVPDKIASDYLAVVTNKALSIVHRAYGTDLYNPARAGEAEALYFRGVGDVKGRKIFGFSNGRPRMHKPRLRGSKWQ